MTTTIAKLPSLWRDEARAYDRYASWVATLLRDKADDLERALLETESRRVAGRQRAEQFVLEQLADGQRCKTVELRKAGQADGFSHADIGRALRALHADGQIAFLQGPRNARLWHLARRDGDEAPNLPATCPAGSDPTAHVPASPQPSDLEEGV